MRARLRAKPQKLYGLTLASLQSGASPKPLVTIIGAEDADDPIQQALISQIGLLKPDIATDVVAFQAIEVHARRRGL